MKHSWSKCFSLFTSLVLQLCFSAVAEEILPRGIGNLRYFQLAYPDITFSRSYDSSVNDWVITLTIPDSNGKNRIASLYWADGALLPKSEIERKESYAPILYKYPKILEDPAGFSEEKKEAIKHFSSDENRKGGAGTAMFFFDAVYDSATRSSVEQHLVKVTFLGKRATVHERIKEPLARVEKRLLALSKYSSSLRTFIKELKSTDSYFWRIIAGTSRRSFHSLGIALDVLPVSQHGKQIFWGWAKEKYPDTWMLLPLEKRWMPPAQVIKIFEEEGFVWGGKWAIFDNMHFEYRPELIMFQNQ
ncbi:MAG: M15 family metallopeptidase [Treponema sp.]|nr:M15 family metallopeptidase [Treponema sp.]